MSSSYTYEAFISYSHVDITTAIRVQQNIERFRIPRRIVAEQNLPSRKFLPVFRDQDELTAAHHLPDALKEALAASRYLIVVCSPAAARSAWVDQEVSEFISLGRRAQVVCVLADGDPGAPDTCLPPALRDQKIPLVIDLRGDTKELKLARLRLAATLLDVGLDQLRQRARQDQRERLVRQSLLVSISLIVVAGLSYRLAIEPPCQNSAERLAASWNSDNREIIAASFAATGLPYAASALMSMSSRMQGYHDDWVAMHREACEATLIRNEQSPQLMDLRMACLDERREEFDSLIELLKGADRQVVEQAVTSAGRLRDLGRCADAEQLEAAYPLPIEPERRAAVEALQQDVARISVSLSVGKVENVQETLPPLLESAQAISFPPLEAEALLLSSQLDMLSGRTRAAQEAAMTAASKAVLARDNELAARAWLALPGIAIRSERGLQEAAQMLTLAQSYIAQLPEGHPLEADFHGARGELRLRSGELEEGVKDMQVAVRISRERNLPDLSFQLSRLAWGLSRLYQIDAAFTAASEAREIAERDFGTQDLRYADALIELARVNSSLGNRDEALNLQSQVVAIEETLYPHDHPRLAKSIQRLGWMYTQAGRFDEAIVAFERAIAMEQSFDDADWRNVAAAYNDMGDAWISKGDYEKAREALTQALNVWQQKDDVASVGIALGNLGNASNRSGRYAEAADYCRRGYANDSSLLPADHPELAYSLTCLGEALIGLQEPAEALEPLSRAHDLRNRIDVDEVSLAWTRWLYGRALYDSGRDPTRGLGYIRFAEDVFTSMGDVTASELSDVTRWLATNDPGANGE